MLFVSNGVEGEGAITICELFVAKTGTNICDGCWTGWFVAAWLCCGIFSTTTFCCFRFKSSNNKHKTITSVKNIQNDFLMVQVGFPSKVVGNTVTFFE